MSDHAADVAGDRSEGEPDDLDARILQLVNSPDYRPVKPRVIARQLELADERRKDVRRALRRLVRQGKLQWGHKHIVHPLAAPAASPAARPPRKRKATGAETVVGVFKRAAGGHGFVKLREPAAGGPREVISISAAHARDAATGDVVQVAVTRPAKGRDARRRGEIVAVVQRDSYQFVGSYAEREGQGVVQVDGRVFTQPIPVGDPGAKNVREGDQVVIEMVRFPRHFDPGEAVITEVLGPRGAPGVDTLAIIREYDLPGEFGEAALRVARQQVEAFDEACGPLRRDLSSATVITIDPADARDFDDAISLTRTSAGHWLLGVHIADVAHFIPADSPLDVEARRRATSVYLPDRVIPMLPELISNNLASLQPNRLRYTRSVFLEFTPAGICVSREVVRTAIVSKHRFNYDEVDSFLADPEAWRDKLAPEIAALLLRMRELAMILRERRLNGGAIELTLPEVKILLDEQGRVNGARLIENTVSHQIIEEFMLAANQAVAESLTEQGHHFLRRIHEPPTPLKLRSLTEFVRQLGIPCESLESRFEIKRVISAVRGEPTEHAVNYAVLRSLQKAVYGPEESGHYALHWQHYCHFTSPIRRYPDLVIHRLFQALEQHHRPHASRGALRALGEHCSEREQRAEAAERELVKLKLLHYLSERLGLQMPAVITGVEEFGLFAAGREFPAEGFIAVSSLQDDYYRFDPVAHALIGYRHGHQFRLGDSLTVEVAHVDLARRELDFRLLSHLPARHLPAQPGSQRLKAAGRASRVKKKRPARNSPGRRRRRK